MDGEVEGRPAKHSEKKERILKLELYNLSADESESKDLASKHPNIVSNIEKIMAQEHIPSPEFPMKRID